MQVKEAKIRYKSVYRPLLTGSEDSSKHYGIIGFDENDNQKFLMDNLPCDYKLVSYIINLLNSNSVAFVHAEDIVCDILYEKEQSLPEYILHKSHS